MPVTINGTTGVIGPDGSAGTPAYQGTDANTGMFFPAADTIAFAEGGVEAMRIDSSGNVGIGISPSYRLQIAAAPATSANFVAQFAARTSGADANVGDYSQFGGAGDSGYFGRRYNATIGWMAAIGGTSAVAFHTGNIGSETERARIDSSGNLLVGTTSADPTFNRVNGNNLKQAGGLLMRTASGGSDFGLNVTSGTHITFYTDNGSARVTAGNIASNGNVTSYNTGSDYRLKEDVAPMAGVLSKIAALKPVTYKWIGNKAQGEGFLAHELAEIIPLAVTGEKDAIKEDGSPDIQSVDYSKIVVHLVAAIQEQQALITSLTARIAALEGAAQ